MNSLPQEIQTNKLMTRDEQVKTINQITRQKLLRLETTMTLCPCDIACET